MMIHDSSSETTLDGTRVLPKFDCRETVRRLWDYLDHELSDAEVHDVDAHLANCERCPPHFAFERAFLTAVRAARDERGAHAALRDRVLTILEVRARDGSPGGTYA